MVKHRKASQEELPAMPKRDDVGLAAESLIIAEEALASCQKTRDEREKELFKIMCKQGRQSVTINDYRFSLRIRPTRQIVAISKPK